MADPDSRIRKRSSLNSLKANDLPGTVSAGNGYLYRPGLFSLTASASYIAAPTAIRASVPEANIGLAMLASLGVTFPVNMLIGLPLYQRWVEALV